MTYTEKLKDPRWQKKRLEVLERDNWMCQLCKDEMSTLHIHHKVYDASGNPWDVENEELITYCFSCHKMVEFLKKYVVPLIVLKTDISCNGYMMLAIVYEINGVKSLGLFRHFLKTDEVQPVVTIKQSAFNTLGELFSLGEINKNLLSNTLMNGQNTIH